MSNAVDVQQDADGQTRCWWCGQDPLYVSYHDDEWGRPVGDDQRLFEKICLEGFQAGLSWITILRRREAFRAAFCDFEFRQLVSFGEDHVEKLVTDASIIRHRGKIESVLNNARRAMELIEQTGSLAAFLWRFEPARSKPPRRRDQIAAKTEESTALSKELKRRGWSFVGPTTCYAMMQAVGMVNDHLSECDTWSIVERSRQEFSRPV